MAQQIKPVKQIEKLPPVLVLSNGEWKPIRGTPWEDCTKQKGFQAIVPRMKDGACGLWHQHWFKLRLPVKKTGEVIQKAAA